MGKVLPLSTFFFLLALFSFRLDSRLVSFQQDEILIFDSCNTYYYELLWFLQKANLTGFIWSDLFASGMTEEKRWSDVWKQYHPLNLHF